MKRRLVPIVVLFVLMIHSCKDDNTGGDTVIRKPVNYMVLLDLSDRLITKGQSERDIELIKTVFLEFSKTVRKNLVINSHDKFQVIVAPQKGIPYDKEVYENSLFLDMGSLNAGVKLNSLVGFERQLTSVLQELYLKANLGNKHSDYPGTGMWQFFNENLQYLAGSSYENKLVILTDGYFDLEDYSRQLPSGKRYPTTSFLAAVRNRNDWKTQIENNDMGLIPVNKEFTELAVYVAEINPKYDFQYESDMLVYIWKKWCHEMEIEVTEVLLKSSLPQTTNLLKNKLTASHKAEKELLSLADKN